MRMIGTQVINRVEFPKYIGNGDNGTYGVYGYSDIHNGGTEITSCRVVVLFEETDGKPVIQLTPTVGWGTGLGTFAVHLPALSYCRVASLAVASCFARELERALEGCGQALDAYCAEEAFI